MATYKGECFCGAVQLEASGEPEGMGVLSLPLMPFVVGRTCQCLHALEAWRGAGHSGRGVYWHVPEDGIEPAAILPEMWRPFDDQSPSAGIGRRLCSYASYGEV